MIEKHPDLESTDSSLDRRRAKLFGAILILLYCIVIGTFLYAPKLITIIELSQKRKNLEYQIDKAKKTDKQLPYYQEKYKKAGTQFRLVEEILPQEMKLKSLMSTIYAAIQECNLTILHKHSLAQREKEFYSEIPINLKVSGTLNNAMLLLDRLIELPRLLTINNLTVDATMGKSLTTVSFSAIAYQYVDSKINKAQIKKKKKKKRVKRKNKIF